MLAGYERRQDDWVHQSRMALAELKQLDKQILAAKIRKDIAKKEFESHEAQTANERDRRVLPRQVHKQELYRWMSSRVAEVYFRGYRSRSTWPSARAGLQARAAAAVGRRRE